MTKINKLINQLIKMLRTRRKEDRVQLQNLKVDLAIGSGFNI